MAASAIVRVDAGAADAEFTTAEIVFLLSALRAYGGPVDRLRETYGGPVVDRLRELLRDGAEGLLVVPDGCTGYYDDFALLAHDGDTCPVHEEVGEGV